MHEVLVAKHLAEFRGGHHYDVCSLDWGISRWERPEASSGECLLIDVPPVVKNLASTAQFAATPRLD